MTSATRVGARAGLRLSASATSPFVGLRSEIGPPSSSGVSGGSDSEFAQQCLCLLVALHVDEPVRDPVAGEELAQPARVG
jgi:hypothetical protein